jgi:hypothetical protein
MIMCSFKESQNKIDEESGDRRWSTIDGWTQNSTTFVIDCS